MMCCAGLRRTPFSAFDAAFLCECRRFLGAAAGGVLCPRRQQR